MAPFDPLMRGADTLFLQRVPAGEGCGAVAWGSGMAADHAELDSVSGDYRKARICRRNGC